MGRFSQLFLALALVAVMGGTFAGIVLLGRHTSVISNHLAREMATFENGNGIFYYNGGYIDAGDYVLLGKALRDDFSRGGVYFIGSSEMNTSIMDWRLPAEERALIRNYSIGDTRHTENRHYMSMLVEDIGILEAGGEKTTIILALTFQQTRLRIEATYVEGLFLRHGLFSYDWRDGIYLRPMPDWQQRLILARDAANRFLRVLFLSPTQVSLTRDSPEQMNAHMVGSMRGDWRANMRVEVDELERTIAYLQERGVNVWAMRVPMGTWQDALPYDGAYWEMVAPMLAERNVPLTDFGDLIADEHFADAVHLHYSGQLLVHEPLRQLALEALAEMGAMIEPVRPEGDAP